MAKTDIVKVEKKKNLVSQVISFFSKKKLKKKLKNKEELIVDLQAEKKSLRVKLESIRIQNRQLETENNELKDQIKELNKKIETIGEEQKKKEKEKKLKDEKQKKKHLEILDSLSGREKELYRRFFIEKIKNKVELCKKMSISKNNLKQLSFRMKKRGILLN